MGGPAASSAAFAPRVSDPVCVRPCAADTPARRRDRRRTARAWRAPAFSPAAIAAYENVISTFYKTQDTWGLSDKPLDAVKAVAFQLGFSDASFNAALTDQDLFNAIQKMRDQAINQFGLEGTPTFYVNGKQLTGEKTLDDLSAEIDPLL